MQLKKVTRLLQVTGGKKMILPPNTTLYLKQAKNGKFKIPVFATQCLVLAVLVQNEFRFQDLSLLLTKTNSLLRRLLFLGITKGAALFRRLPTIILIKIVDRCRILPL